MAHTGRRSLHSAFTAVAALALAAAAALPAHAQDDSAPEPPTGLSTEVSHDSVTLSWDDPRDDSITGYVILRRDKDIHPEGTFVTLAPDTGSAATAYVDASVDPERRYVYRIKAINAHGTSDRSNWVRAYTPAAPEPSPGRPAKPTGLSTGVSHDSVTLSWDDPRDGTVTGYVILRRDKDVHPQGTFRTITADTGSAATAYVDASVDPERRYVYRIKAINAHGPSDRSNWVRAYTPAAGASGPAPPQREIGAAAASDGAGAAPVWSATLTVGEDASLVPAASGYSAWGLGGTLTEDMFTVGGTTYRVLVLAQQSGGLVFGLDEELESDFTLTVGDVSYAAQDGSRPEAMYTDAYWWDAHQSIDWSAGEALEVSLTVVSGPGASRPQLPLAPPMAYFTQVPENHNGVDPFNFRLHFSQDIATDAENLRDHALGVAGGWILAVERVNGSNRIWDITVAPGSGDVIIAMPEGTVDYKGVILSSAACDAPGAICTGDGRKLYNRPEFTVPGPDSGNEEPPAAEDTLVWSATMTAARVYWGYGYYSTHTKQAGSLSPASFEVDATTYTVTMIEAAGWMYIGTDREIPFGFVLELDGARFASEDAYFQTYSYGNIYQWRATGLSWNDADTVEFRLLRTAEDETAATGAPTITGTAQVGETLTADRSGITDPDGLDNASFAYQWTAGGRDIDGADDPSLTLTHSERGRTIAVRVSFTDDAGNRESLTSEPTAAVARRAQPPGHRSAHHQRDGVGGPEAEGAHVGHHRPRRDCRRQPGLPGGRPEGATSTGPTTPASPSRPTSLGGPSRCG